MGFVSEWMGDLKGGSVGRDRYTNLYMAVIKLVMRLDDVYVGLCYNTLLIFAYVWNFPCEKFFLIEQKIQVLQL